MNGWMVDALMKKNASDLGMLRTLGTPQLIPSTQAFPRAAVSLCCPGNFEKADPSFSQAAKNFFSKKSN